MGAKSDEYDYVDKLSFLGEWFDYEVSFHKQFLVNYFPYDNTIELFDRDLKRIYLRRAICDGVHMKDMFIGSKIKVYGRQIRITGYADTYTQNRIGKSKEHTFAMIKPNATDHLGPVMSHIEEGDFTICRLIMCNMTRKEALDFYDNKKGDPFLPFMLENLASGPVVALDLIGENAIERWRETIGPKDPAEARKTAPGSLRALYGVEQASNGFHGSDTLDEAVRSACFFFPQGLDRKPPASTALINNSTLCIIKPHAIEEKKVGHIINAIMENPRFRITAMQMYYLTPPNADEFLEVYRGVVSDFHAFMMSYLEGPCIAMEISARQEGLNTHEEFRKFTGPFDADIARQIRPTSLRGLFGISKYKNAVHCTDLPEDAILELEYFFKILKD